jgi:exopolysaccharide biosynthesis polyprenyl glycosylphosphotransferase
MLTQSHRARVRLSQLVDGALFALAVILAYGLRAAFQWLDLPELEAFSTYLWLCPAVAVLGPAMLASQGFYEQPQLTSRLAMILIVLRGCAFTVLGTILLLFLARHQFARSIIILIGAFGGIFVYIRHEVTQWSLRRHPARRRVLWVGRPDENARLQSALSGLERDAIESIGEWDPTRDTIENFVSRLHREAVGAVVLTLAGVDRVEAEAVISACESEGVEVLVRPGLFRTSPYRLTVDAFAGEPVLHLRAQSAPAGQLVLKQLLDYTLAGALLLVFSPLMLVIVWGIRLTSPGPVLFRQQRAGLNGQPFWILKFRTMRLGAENEQAVLAKQNELNGPAFKLRRDPRVTPFGRVLRRHSLDELPQLWNVLRGEMSLVGPRPLPIAEAAQIAAGQDRRRLSVKPGMTGLWQISGRSDLADFADWVRLDLAYIDQWSLWLDVKILFATVPVALLGRGGR